MSTEPNTQRATKYSGEGDACPNCGCQILDPFSSSHVMHDVELCKRLSPPAKLPPPETGAVDVEKLIAEIYRTQNSSPQHLLAKRLTIVIQLAIDPLTARISELEKERVELMIEHVLMHDKLAAAEARVKEMEEKLEGALKLTTASSINHVSKLER